MPDEEAIAQWVLLTCLTFGATLSTALIVAGYFLRALEEARSGG